MQQLPNAPQELLSMEEQNRIALHVFPLFNWVTNCVTAELITSIEIWR
jgi:hypothetical protein